MEYSFIIAVIPVILVIAFLVWIAKKITDGERLDMKEGVLGVVILMVAVLVMVPMISSTQVYTWDGDTGELVIQQNISGGSYAWDTYDDQIKSIVIKPGVTQIGNSAFDGATNLEYLSIPESVTDIGTNVFGVGFENYMGQTITDISAGEYVGSGDGTVYLSDSSIFTYSADGSRITGLAAGATAATHIVLPATHNGIAVKTIGSAAFQGTGIETVGCVPSCAIETVQLNAFRECSSLSVVELPDTITAFGASIFRQCTSLTSFKIPAGLETLAANTFTLSGIASIVIPDTMKVIELSAFLNCTSLAEVRLSSGLTAIGATAFTGDTGIVSVTFAAGFGPTLESTWASSWTFYATDATTQIDATDASALAGRTFQGTASALVEVEPGRIALTPEQIQQVHLHDAELQDLKDQISIEPLPLQPSLQEQELTA